MSKSNGTATVSTPKNARERKAQEKAREAARLAIVEARKAQDAPAPAPVPSAGHVFPARPVPTEKPAPEAQDAPEKTTSAAINAQRGTAALLKNVADPTRLAIVHALAQANLNVTEMMHKLGLNSQPALSHHLALMRHVGTVESVRDGKNNIYCLTEKGQALYILASSLNA